MLTDIRKFMPQTPQTNDDNFPEYVYEPYPRQMTYMDGKRLKPYLNPDGTPVTVHSASEEAEFRASKGEEVKQPEPAPTVAIDPAAIPDPDKPRRGRPPKPAHVSSMPADLK